MGNAFSFIRWHAAKNMRRFNAHNRAEKYLEKHKETPQRAPLYEATMKEVEKLVQEMPDLTEELKKKDKTLVNNLRQVYVTSSGDNKDSFSDKRVDCSGEARALEYLNPDREVLKDVPAGSYTMEQALTMIKKYQINPIVNSTKALAMEFKLEPEVVAKITKHVKILDYHAFQQKKLSTKETLLKELLPPSFQGKFEPEIYDEMLDTHRKRILLFYEKAERLENPEEEKRRLESGDNQSYLFPEPRHNLLSKNTADALEQVYSDTDIYRKTGKLPEQPKQLEDPNLKKLSIEEINKIEAGLKDESTKELQQKDQVENKELVKNEDHEDKKKVSNQT